MSSMKHSVSFERPPQVKSLEINFHELYERNHYVCNCVLPLRHQRRVIHNYEQLAPAEKISVPTTSHHRVRAIRGVEDDEGKL